MPLGGALTAAGTAALASAAGTAGAIGISKLLGGGGGGGGGGFGSLNPAASVLNEIFDTFLRTHKGAVFPKTRKGGTPGGIFAELPSRLEDLFEPLPIDPLESLGFGLGEGAAGGVRGLGSFLDQVLPFASELMETGFRTDLNIQPIINEALRSFREDFLPQAKESFSDLTGVFGSPIQEAFGREAGRITSGLGALEATLRTELDESAALRRLTGLQAAPALASAVFGLPFNFAREITGFGTARRGIEESLRPGAREFDVFRTLADLGNQLPFVQGGFNPTDPATAGLSALAEIVPAVIGSGSSFDFGSLFGGGGSPVGPGPAVPFA